MEAFVTVPHLTSKVFEPRLSRPVSGCQPWRASRSLRRPASSPRLMLAGLDAVYCFTSPLEFYIFPWLLDISVAITIRKYYQKDVHT